ncbi:hypothetical protein CALVIDRAFT_595449 [Calocera viscosa TUFC12733]|uniref:F-box domain-containing protein n=1 Tax=Calocera viscosa (strain TUFC12733) TaxID=1330018 RepID=A0A167QKL8_CALVF|nr:hypothetical protein CALVIDRAFT_595449 [Calocera viscosa TUFC12733]
MDIILTISSVCTTWRTTALNLSGLWTNVLPPWTVDLEPERWENAQEHILHRLTPSRDRKLTVFLLEYTLIPPIFRLLSENGSHLRVKKLHFSGNPYATDPVSLVVFPRVEELNLEIWDLVQVHAFLRSYSRIKHLTLQCRVLQGRCSRTNGGSDLDAVQLPELDTLTIVNATAEEQDNWLHILHPPKLRALQLRTDASLPLNDSYWDRWDRRLVGNSRLPQTWPLTLHSRHVALLSIRKLVLGDWSARHQTQYLLEGLPSVESLQLICPRPTRLDYVAAALTDVNVLGQLVLAPKLEILSFHNGRFAYGKFERMLSARTSIGVQTLRKLRVSKVTLESACGVYEYDMEVPDGIVLEHWQPPWV